MRGGAQVRADREGSERSARSREAKDLISHTARTEFSFLQRNASNRQARDAGSARRHGTSAAPKKRRPISAAKCKPTLEPIRSGGMLFG
jgi:hypothetical protein